MCMCVYIYIERERDSVAPPRPCTLVGKPIFNASQRKAREDR